MVLVTGWLVLAVGCLAGWACRFLLIEPREMEVLCLSASAPAWCEARALLLSMSFPPRYGLVAVAAGVTCWAVRRRPAAAFAWTGLVAGGLGLFLYDTGWSASGVILALLRLPRIGEEPADPREFSA